MKTFLKSAVLIALLMAAPWVFGQSGGQDSLRVLGMEGRIANLELMRDNLSREVDLHKQELGGEIHRTDVYVIFGILTSVFGAGWILLGVRGLRKVVLAKAESYLDAELQKQLPLSTRNQIKELMQHVLPEEIEPFLQLIRQKKEEEKLKLSTSIVVLAETPDRGKAVVNDLRENGFKDMTIEVPQSDDLPPADLYVFARREPEPDGGWKVITDTFVKRILDKNRQDESRVFFYYGPQNDALNTKMHTRFGFANMPNTLSDNLLKLVSKPTNPKNQ